MKKSPKISCSTRNKNLKGIIYFLLASMFLISSCKKDENS